MRYLALAADYDGTLATDGIVPLTTINALEALRRSGRKLLLVTGREIPDLLRTFSRPNLFDLIVAENGALLYDPATQQETVLCAPPPPPFVETLKAKGVAPISEGRCIVATWRPHETAVLETIRELSLELQVIFNKGAVMILPAGINKATGLRAALEALRLSAHNIVGVGDAENDHSFLSLCACSAAVANALPALSSAADLNLNSGHGAGVEELIAMILKDDLAQAEPRLHRHRLLVGLRGSEEIRIPPFGTNIFISGTSGAGKSTFAHGFLERLAEQEYQFCVIDPEGDYEAFEDAVCLGDMKRPPTVDEIAEVLFKPKENVIANLIGVPFSDRPRFFLSLLTRLQELRASHGRPHWIIADEAYHVLPAQWDPAPQALPEGPDRMVYIAIGPRDIYGHALETVNTFVGVGEGAPESFREFRQRQCAEPVPLPSGTPQAGELLFWSKHYDSSPVVLTVVPGKKSKRRHQRKYAEGELPPDRSFFFRGPEKKLNLRAQNLVIFVQVAEGVDDATWDYHLKGGHVAEWFRGEIKDPDLADEAEQISRRSLPASESRQEIRRAIERHYTLPASGAYSAG